MDKSSQDQINILIRARLPVVWVVSYEENRVEEAIEEIINNSNERLSTEISLWKWSFTSGLECESKDLKEPDMQSPTDVLDHILERGSQAVYVLRDFGHFLSTGNAYYVQRKLRDVAHFVTNMGTGVTIIILDSQLEVPDRVEKDIAVVDFDLPTENELTAHLKAIIGPSASFADLSQEEADQLLEKGVTSARGLTLSEAENVFAKSIAETKTIVPEIITAEKKHIIRRSGVLEFYDLEQDMNAVGGLDVLKDWLRGRARAYTREARDYGLPAPKGILLVGIPGTGKSLIAKCVGREWQMPVLRMDVGALFGSFVGQSEANMRKALKTAEALAPCVLWIDEVEKSIGGGSNSLDGGTTARVFGSFLSWMQEKTADVFVVATANDVSQLPPEMLRKGRFDELFFCDLPDLDSRKEILSIHINRIGRDPQNYDIDALAEASVNLSGAELEEAVKSSMFVAFQRNSEPTTEDIQAAIKGTVPLLTTMQEKINALRAWAGKRARRASSKMPESAMEIRNNKKSKKGRGRGVVLPSLPGSA